MKKIYNIMITNNFPQQEVQHTRTKVKYSSRNTVGSSELSQWKQLPAENGNTSDEERRESEPKQKSCWR